MHPSRQRGILKLLRFPLQTLILGICLVSPLSINFVTQDNLAVSS